MKRGGSSAPVVVRGKGKSKAEPSIRKATSNSQQHETTETVVLDEINDVQEVAIEVQGQPQQNGSVQTRVVQIKGKELVANTTRRSQQALQRQLDRANMKLQEVIR